MPLVRDPTLCPICGEERPTGERYPLLVCTSCASRTRDAAGAPVGIFNTGLMGTGAAAHYPDGSAADLENMGAAGWPVFVVYIEGARCAAQEAYVGGIVISLIDD